MKKNKGFAAVLTFICTAFIAAAAFAGDANWEPGQVYASALLDERQTSYPSVCEHNGRFYIAYDHARGGYKKQEILMAKITVCAYPF